MRPVARINSITLKWFRGFRDTFTIDANGRSVLIVGPNGSGKSSVTDAIEWFLTDKVTHLFSEEAGKLLESLRNEFIGAGEEPCVEIKFSGGVLDNVKTIKIKKSGMSAENSNKSAEFKNFIAACGRESVILRSGTLNKFITATKSDKLKLLFDVIGFSEVAKVSASLKNIVSDYEKLIKSRNYESVNSGLQAELIKLIGCNAYTDGNLVEGVNRYLGRHAGAPPVTSLDGVDAAANALAAADPNRTAAKLAVIDELRSAAEGCVLRFGALEQAAAEFAAIASKLKDGLDKISRIFIENLLTSGVEVLKNKAYTDDKCPLCLQPVKRLALLADIEARINELGEIKAVRERFAAARKKVLDNLTATANAMDNFMKKEPALLADAVFDELKPLASELSKAAVAAKSVYDIELTAVMDFTPPADLTRLKSLPEAIVVQADTGRQKLEALAASNKNLEIASNLKIAKSRYVEYVKNEAQKKELEHQLKSLKLVLDSFMTKQKTAVDRFLTTYSSKINDIYQRLNPGENNEDFRLSAVPSKDDDQLAGLTLEFNFQNKATGSPLKYLSESHLNALGIALFLTAASAFNKNCEFIVLDDVASSFDAEHRERFAEFIKTGLADKQVIMMTHDVGQAKMFDDWVNAGNKKIEL